MAGRISGSAKEAASRLLLASSGHKAPIVRRANELNLYHVNAFIGVVIDVLHLLIGAHCLRAPKHSPVWADRRSLLSLSSRATTIVCSLPPAAALANQARAMKTGCQRSYRRHYRLVSPACGRRASFWPIGVIRCTMRATINTFDFAYLMAAVRAPLVRLHSESIPGLLERAPNIRLPI